MAISYVGQATGTTTVTLPAHQAGDILLAFAFRDGSTTAPTATTNWTNVNNPTGANACSARIQWVRARGPNTPNPTFANATSTVVLVYRGAHPISPIGGTGLGTGTAASVTYPAIGAMTKTDSTSWVVGFAGHVSVDTTLETAPTGMTNRSTVVDATDEAAGHDTNGGVASWSAVAVAVGGTASGWVARTVELLAAPSYTYGTNKIHNPDFNANTTTDWTAVSSATISATTPTAGKLNVQAPASVAGPPSARQELLTVGEALIVGNLYRLRWKAESVSSAIAAMLFYNSSFGTTYCDYEYTGATQAQFEEWFVAATDTNAVIFPAVRTVSGLVKFDDIELQEATVAPTNSTLTADTRSYALTGVAAGLKVGLKLPSATGSLALTGNIAALRVARKLLASTGAFALSGVNAGLTEARKLTAGTGSFSIAGNAAGLKFGRALAAGTGSYALTGNDATLSYDSASLNYTLTAGTCALTLTGIDASLKVARRLTAVTGSLGLTGNNAGLIYSGGEQPSVPVQGDGDILGGQGAVRRSKRLHDPRSAMERLLDTFRAAHTPKQVAQAIKAAETIKETVLRPVLAVEPTAKVQPALTIRWDLALEELRQSEERQADVLRTIGMLRAIQQEALDALAAREAEEEEEAEMLLLAA